MAAASQDSSLAGIFKMAKKCAQSEQVTVPAKTANLADSQRGGQADVAKFLTPVDVGKMYLNERQLNRGKRIADGNAGVGISSGIDQDAVAIIRGSLNGIDQISLGVGLEKRDAAAEFFGQLPDGAVDLFQRQRTIHFRLAPAEEIKVGAVQYQEFHA